MEYIKKAGVIIGIVAVCAVGIFLSSAKDTRCENRGGQIIESESGFWNKCLLPQNTK